MDKVGARGLFGCRFGGGATSGDSSPRARMGKGNVLVFLRSVSSRTPVQQGEDTTPIRVSALSATCDT